MSKFTSEDYLLQRRRWRSDIEGPHDIGDMLTQAADLVLENEKLKKGFVIPAGMQLMPIEPTDSIIDAMLSECHADDCGIIYTSEMRDGYRAAILAAKKEKYEKYIQC